MPFQQQIKIGDHLIANYTKPYIIAEMACAHDGDYDKAIRIIEGAAKAGADAIQLQFFIADETVTPHHEVYQILKKIEFSRETWGKIIQYCRDNTKLHVFVCTYDLPSLGVAMELGVDGIKLNSADLSNPPLLEKVAASGLPFTLGTGASTFDEVQNGLDHIRKHGGSKAILMHGVQNFPTAIQDLNIVRVKRLMEAFDMPVGYHDHTEGESAISKVIDLAALGLGAAVLEKHITLDRSEKGIDYQAALEPDEFKNWVDLISTCYPGVGKPVEKPLTESDMRYRKFQKKSIVAAADIAAGEVITSDRIKYLRNAEPGLPPDKIEQVIGKVARNPIPRYQNIDPALLQ